MSRASIPPSLAELLTRYLEKQTDACALGTAACADEVVPYDAGPVQPIDPKRAWDEACAVFALEGLAAADVRGWKAPPQWSSLVAGHEPVLALALCAANFPQLVRNFHMVLETANPGTPAPSPGPAAPVPELAGWAEALAERKQFPQVLLALGTLRLAKQFDAAHAYAQQHDADVPPAWRAAWENEKAALAWHAGRTEAARTAWQAQAPTVPVLFNRGMAELFLGQPAAAHAPLAAAVEQLPERSAWHHLGRLYLTLAQQRAE